MFGVDRRTVIHLALGVVLVLSAAACGGGEGASDSDGDTRKSEVASGLPVSAPDGPVDGELAGRGDELFRTRGCTACHQLGGGRLVGPDLEGVTERRSFEWTYHMVMNPDSMLQNDSIARRMLQEYYTPMSDQNVTPEQFVAIYEYLRSASP